MSSGKKGTRQEQAVETKQALILAAVKLFAEKGYEATGVREICRSIGLADGLLYHYFPKGKTELLQEIVIVNSKLILSDLKNYLIAIENLPLEELFMSYYYHSVDIYKEHKDALRIIFREIPAFKMEERLQILGEIDSQEKEWLPELLEKRAKAGEISEIDYKSAAASITPMLLGNFLRMLMGFECFDKDEKSEEFFRRIIKFHINLWKK
ncbi:MAG: TetR/AcrR family transcriptional regulator [Clostridiales bacterium]|nr:TetR/AcrR family transcriptional regulator [Clostridiales bacterium]